VPLSIIATTISSIKGAIDIGSFILKSDSALDRAILKGKVEEMMDSLSDAKKVIRELEDIIYEKDKELTLLKESDVKKPQNVGYLGARYLVNQDNEPTGSPYCPTCWASKKELSPLISWSTNEATHKCGNCGITVEARLSPLNAEQYIKRNRELAQKHKTPFEIEVYK